MSFRTITPMKFKDMTFRPKKQLFCPQLASTPSHSSNRSSSACFFGTKLRVDEFYLYICLINHIPTEKQIRQ